MKTIIHVVQHLSPGGLETMVLDMLAFTNPEHKIVLVSLEGTLTESIQRWPRLSHYQEQLIFLDKPSGFQTSTIKKLISIFKEHQADIVHSHHIGPLLYAGCAVKWYGKAEHIHTEHDAWHLNNKKHRYLQRLALSISEPKLVADAHFVKKTLSLMFNKYPIYTIKNGIDTSKFQSGHRQDAHQTLRLNLPEESIIIGNAARLEMVKGQDKLIEAFRFLDSKYHLLLAGSGSEKEYLQRLVAEYHLEKRVHFLGHIDHMPTFYQALDVFCLPSNNEGFPLSTLEAQSCGVPCIANDVGGVSETLCPTYSLLVANNDAITLAQGIQALAYQKETGSPRDFILKNNHAGSMATAYESLYFQGVTI